VRGGGSGTDRGFSKGGCYSPQKGYAVFFNRKSTDERFRDLRDEIASLKRLVESRDLDWADMRARCKRLLDRTEKVAARSVEQEPQPAGGAHPPQDGALTAAAAPASRMERIKAQLKAAGKEVPDGVLPR